LVYDITKRETFASLDRWLREIQDHGESGIAVTLVGNKSDLGNLRVISTKEGTEYAQKHGMKFMETSAFSGVNVDIVFESTVQMI
jgi:GTPase SAR1 family protein